MDQVQKPIQPTPQPAPQDAVEADIKKAETFLAQVKGTNFSSVFKDIFSKYKIFILGLLAFFVVAIALGITFSIFGNRMKKRAPTPTPVTLAPTPTPPEEIKNPSRYATDSGVLKIQSDIEALDKDLNSVDLKENFLRPPAIQFDESF